MSRITVKALRNMAATLDQDFETTEQEWRRFWIGLGKTPEIIGVDMGHPPGDATVVVESAPEKKPKFWLVDEEGDARLNAHLRTGPFAVDSDFISPNEMRCLHGSGDGLPGYLADRWQAPCHVVEWPRQSGKIDKATLERFQKRWLAEMDNQARIEVISLDECRGLSKAEIKLLDEKLAAARPPGIFGVVRAAWRRVLGWFL